jgi:hypothetical protein
MTTTLDRTPATERIEKLNRASLRKVIDPDLDLPGSVGDGQVLPDELLSIHQLPEFEALTAEQRATLAREEVASIVELGLRFEAVLMAGFALDIVASPDLTDARVVYALHEVGEETRHSRMFSRLLSQLAPKARNPLARFRWLEMIGIRQIIRRPTTFDILVLGGEEIPDLYQKVAAEHPDTDPFIREVNKYHRAEEARHLAFARTILPEKWARATVVDRFLVRHVVPRVIWGMFDTTIQPGVYATVGLPAFRTWRRGNRTPFRVGMRQQASRPIVKALLDGGVLKAGRIPRVWQRLAGVDSNGAALSAAPA